MKSVTLKAVAQACGVSAATVSLALRDHPKIPVQTRSRIKTMADRLGYAPNRSVARVMSEIRLRSGAVPFKETLAFLRDPAAERSSNWPKLLEAGVRKRAGEIGYGIECINIDTSPEAMRRLSRVLRARGIRGVIIAPLHSAGIVLEMDWQYFGAVAIGYTLASPDLHRVGRDILHAMQEVYAELRRRGYRRFGFFAQPSHEARMDQALLAAYLVEQSNHPVNERPKPLLTESFTPSVLEKWIQREQPDVIMSQVHGLTRMLRQAGLRVPEDIGVMLSNTGEDRLESGLRPNYEGIGEAAVERVVALIEHDSLGVPRLPQTTLVRGIWQEGSTIRPAGEQTVKL